MEKSQFRLWLFPFIAGIIISGIVQTNSGVIRLNQREQNELQEKKDHDKFNSITQKCKVENQNQKHNARKEGIAPINQKR